MVQQDDRGGHFGIRFMSGQDKRLIADAAKRHQMTVGEFVARACQESVMRERQALEPTRGEIVGPPIEPRAVEAPPSRLDRVHERLAVLEHAKQIAGMTPDLRHRLKQVMAAFDAQEGLDPPPARSRRPDGRLGRASPPPALVPLLNGRDRTA